MAETRQTAWYARPYAIACLIAMVVLLLAGFVVRAATETASSRPVCSTADAALAGVWDAASRARLARQVTDAARAHLADYVRAWRRSYDSACRGNDDRRLACVEARRVDLAALVRLFARDRAAAGNAAVLIEQLTPVAACAEGAP